MADFLTLIGFGPTGWGMQLLRATLMTVSVSIAAFATGLVFGTAGAAAKLFGGRLLRTAAELYTTLLRGVPELLVIYVFYFGGSQVLTAIGHALGGEGFFGVNGFIVGALAVGTVSGAYQTEVLRGAYLAVPRTEVDAARALGLRPWLILRLILVPRVLRIALPALGNLWQGVLKGSALISVAGLVELLRQMQIASGATHRPFDFYLTGALLFLLLTTISGFGFRRMERWSARGEATT